MTPSATGHRKLLFGYGTLSYLPCKMSYLSYMVVTAFPMAHRVAHGCETRNSADSAQQLAYADTPFLTM